MPTRLSSTRWTWWKMTLQALSRREEWKLKKFISHRKIPTEDLQPWRFVMFLRMCYASGVNQYRRWLRSKLDVPWGCAILLECISFGVDFVARTGKSLPPWCGGGGGIPDACSGTNTCPSWFYCSQLEAVVVLTSLMHVLGPTRADPGSAAASWRRWWS